MNILNKNLYQIWQKTIFTDFQHHSGVYNENRTFIPQPQTCLKASTVLYTYLLLSSLLFHAAIIQYQKRKNDHSKSTKLNSTKLTNKNDTRFKSEDFHNLCMHAPSCVPHLTATADTNIWIRELILIFPRLIELM
jgi:hypothetical protein